MRLDDLDFLIIGAAKSATTWLQRSLQADPSICMPNPELHYFSREYDRGDDWYLAQFPDNAEARLTGEKSNSYLDNPDASRRVFEKLPHVKIVAQLRNPVDRAYSDYCMLYRRGELDQDIERHLDPLTAGQVRPLAGGLYHHQLTRYFDLYPREKSLVLLYEDLQVAPQSHLNRLRTFLGLKATPPSPPTGARVKDKTDPILSLRMRRALKPLKPIVAPMRQAGVFRAVRGLLAQEVKYPPLTNSLRLRLVDFYSEEIRRLESLLQRDLSIWLEATRDEFQTTPARQERGGLDVL